MAIINQNNILNLQPGITAPVVVHMSEGDVGTKLSFKLIDGARAWTDPGNVVAAVHGRRQDGTQFGPYACTISGDVVSFQTDAAIAAVAGSGIAQIVLTDSDENTAGSANFAIMVERATFPAGVTYTNDVSVYEAILRYAQSVPAWLVDDYTAKIAEEAEARESADTSLMSQTASLHEEIAEERLERDAQDALLSARMDSFARLPDGSLSTAADAELADIRVRADGLTATTAGDAVREQIGELKSVVKNNLQHVLAPPMGRTAETNGLTIVADYDVVTINGTATDHVLFVFKSDGTIATYTGFSPAFVAADIRNTLIAGRNYRITSRLIGGTITRGGNTYTPTNLWGTANVARSYLMEAGAAGSSDYIARASLEFFDFALDENTSEVGAFCIYLYSGGVYDNAKFYLCIDLLDEIQKSAADFHHAATNWPELNRVVARANIGTMSRAELEASGIGALEFSLGAISTPAVGSVLSDFTPASDDRGIVSAIAPCAEGDEFKVNVTGAGAAAGGGVRAYAWLASDGTVLAESARNVTISDTITAPANAAYLVLNNFTATTADFYAVRVTSEDDEAIPAYWSSTVASGISRANRVIVDAGAEDTLLYITDLHWYANEKHSPAIARKIMTNCNINYFVNGGDIIEGRHADSKYSAAQELQDCVDAFKGLPYPMITLYGNHDRNRNSNTEHPEAYLTYQEHFNLVNMSFSPNPYIKYANSDLFYWDGQNYRFVCMYWYYSASRTQPGLAEVFDTDKPVVVLCHGIYFTAAADPANDVIDNGWILGVLEPYKTQIRCIIQGHTHRDALRYAWETVPIIILTCDKTKTGTAGTDEEQALSIVTINSSTVYVTRIGYGDDFTVAAGDPIWQTLT